MKGSRELLYRQAGDFAHFQHAIRTLYVYWFGVVTLPGDDSEPCARGAVQSLHPPTATRSFPTPYADREARVVTKINDHERDTGGIVIDDRELEYRFIRASGPGGQNVNKVATAVQLRFDAARSPSLSEEVRARLIKLAGRRATSDGVLVIDARRHRTQVRNREDAHARLSALIQKATETRAPRKKTRPTMSSKRRRLESKRHQGAAKRLRGTPDNEA